MQKDKVKEFYIQKDKFGYFHVVAVSENGDEFIIAGDICGGIPQISWHLLPKEQSNHE